MVLSFGYLINQRSRASALDGLPVDWRGVRHFYIGGWYLNQYDEFKASREW